MNRQPRALRAATIPKPPSSVGTWPFALSPARAIISARNCCVILLLPLLLLLLILLAGGTYPHACLGQVGPHGDLFPGGHVRVAVAAERLLELVQLL